MEPSDNLRAGRRILEGIEGYELIEDLIWDYTAKHWSFKFKLIGEYTETEYVPIETEWYCFLSDDYPYGKLEIYPSSTRGLSATFPHMLYNRNISKPWRTGNICVKTHYGIWGESFFNTEPFDISRIEWAIHRSKAWLMAAAENRLFSEGDPFEFPDMPTKKLPTVGFLETEENLTSFWNKTTLKNGIVRIKKFQNNDRIIAVLGFKEKNTLITYDWGHEVEGFKDEKALSEGLWYLLPKIPVLPPWQIPETWEELFSCCQAMGVDLEQWIHHQLIERKLFNRVTKLLLGFPVSDYIGSQPTRLHWFCLDLFKNDIKLNGFRDNSRELYVIKVKIELNPIKKIQWMLTENLANDQLTTRGNVSLDLQSKNNLIIGCGAIGSQITELLVRLGCTRLTLVDNDTFSPGNAARHTLTFNSTNLFKSEELAKRLNSIFPTCKIEFVKQEFMQIVYSKPDFLEPFDLVMDLTAEDDVFKDIIYNISGKEKIFISLSMGLNASRLFCYMDKTPKEETFSYFKSELSPWLKKQKEENPDVNFQLEGIGCWHPVFPARLDDIIGLLAPVIRITENFLQSDLDRQFVVIERQENGETKISRNE